MCRLLLPVLLFLLAACAAAPRDQSPEEYTRASCTRSCNHDYDVCMDAGASRLSNGVFSGGDTCKRQIKQCLAPCNGTKP
jgi:hypothetical protein